MDWSGGSFRFLCGNHGGACQVRHSENRFDVATALRTVVVLAFSWGMVFLVGSQKTIGQISGKSLLFLVLSGLSTGASWLCYY